jgi:ribosomal protein S18 acetylase RimI-like enzyme
MPQLRPFTRGDLGGAMRLFAAERWQTYTADAERTYRALAAPGSTTLVAVEGELVVGLIQLQSDGQIQAHLSALLVGEGWRRRGLARALLREALSQAGGLRMDIISAAGNFYLHLGARALSGFRLERRELGLEGPA